MSIHSRKLIPAAVLGPAVLLAGCASTGLSPRESAGRDISSFTPASFRLDYAAEEIPSRPVGEQPLSVVAVQMGEVAPPQRLMERLQAEPELFTYVQPGSGVIRPTHTHHRGRGAAEQADPMRDQAQQLLQTARDMGADALLLYGGTIDTDDRGTPLSLLDVTIVGAFVVPSRVLEAEGRATAMLVDARTGRIRLSTSADATDTGLATTFGKRGAQRNQLQEVRDEVVDELTEQIIEALRSRRGLDGTDTTAQARS